MADLSEVVPQAAVVVVGLPDVEADFLAAVRAGVVGYLLATIRSDALVRAVKAVADGRASFPRHLTRVLAGAFHDGMHHLDLPAPCRPAYLTEREWEVLQLLWQGRGTNAIAERLFISPATVRTHLAAIRHKLGVASRAELLGIVEQTDDMDSSVGPPDGGAGAARA